MSDEEEDYMSASFLNVKEDIRPGLIKSKILKRKYEIEEKAKVAQVVNRTKKLREIEEESRNAGMDTAISTDNKGFAMLQKMGYKPGMKLGPQKSETASNSGLQEPIRLKIKTDRGGLGREDEIKRKIKEKEEMKMKIKVWKESETEQLANEFRQRMREKVVYKNLMSDLNKMRKVCEKLDTDEDIKEPMRPWFWFTYEDYDEDEEHDDCNERDDDDEEIDPEDQVYFINEYLRGKYFYCVWCGTKYDDESDMLDNCPGTEKDDHE